MERHETIRRDMRWRGQAAAEEGGLRWREAAWRDMRRSGET